MNSVATANRPDRLRNSLVELADGTTVHGTYVLSKTISFTNITDDGAPHSVFKINTSDVASDGGAYTCFIHGMIGHHVSAASGYVAAKRFDAHFTRVLINTGATGVTGPVIEAYEASVASAAASRDIGACAITTLENTEHELQVQFQVDLTGTSADAAASAIFEVVLVWYGFSVQPTITVM